MVICVHGFDWAAYEKRVMPAFARWLIDRDASAVQQLFEQTRFAREERFVPDPMQRLRVWPRASTFLETLPRGLYSRREYQLLCSAEQFTALSDQYMYSHIPQLYQNSDALCSIWAAIIEDFCLPWGQETEAIPPPTIEQQDEPPNEPPAPARTEESEEPSRSELASLLNAAGLPGLAQEVGEQGARIEGAGEVYDIPVRSVDELTGYDDDDELEESTPLKKAGIAIGQHPNTLRLRGWLAGISLRAMVLFEYLACGRRGMPFGPETDESFGIFSGYLTPAEVRDLAAILHNAQPPKDAAAEAEYREFRLQQTGRRRGTRLIDEVPPTNVENFLQAVKAAEQQGLGLICSLDT